jgi:aspartate carbamoyltransferase regulatory subunit
MLEDYFLNIIDENPQLRMEDVIRDKSLDDDWIKSQQEELKQEEIQRLFKSNPKMNVINDKDFEVVEKDSV